MNKKNSTIIIISLICIFLASWQSDTNANDGVLRKKIQRIRQRIKEKRTQKDNNSGDGTIAKETGVYSNTVKITTIIKDGGRLDWSEKLNLIAFDRKADDNFYDVWTMNPDGSNQICISCGNPNLPTKHVGQPEWHPNGKYIVVQAEKEYHKGGSLKARPGIGVDNDLWVILLDEKKAYQLTDIPGGKAVLHPKFSKKGNRIIWAQMIEAPPKRETLGGKWEIKMADFIIEENNVHLENVRSLDTGKNVFFETHGFSKDDSSIIFTANMEPNQPAWTMDIYTMNLETNEIKNLTNSNDWDEHAHWSPDGKKIVWMSSKDSGTNPEKMSTMTTDLWMMNDDGTDKQRLTHFSDPNYPEYMGNVVVVGDPAWCPDGKSIMCRLIVDRGLAQLVGLKEEIEPIMLIELKN